MNKLIATLRVSVVDGASNALLQQWDAAADLHGDVLLSKAFENLRDLSDKITAAIKRDKVESDLDVADAERDAAIHAISDMIRGYKAVPIAAIKDAAARLDAVFSKYGTKIADENYISESSFVESLLSDFSAEKMKSDAASLAGMSEAIEVLRAAQGKFDAARLAFNVAKKGRGESASALKKPLVECINAEIVPYLSAAARIDGEKYASFAARIEGEIERANAAK